MGILTMWAAAGKFITFYSQNLTDIDVEQVTVQQPMKDLETKCSNSSPIFFICHPANTLGHL